MSPPDSPFFPGLDGLRVPEAVSHLLRDLIHERTGIFFEDSRCGTLLEKLAPLAKNRKLGSYLDYYYLLKDGDVPEWNHVWEALSVQESYFWREMSQINALTSVIVPEWFRRHSTPFRIWTAASAGGEEPYTIAMALAEAGQASFPVEILASDASIEALKKAEAAIYRERSFRALPLALREKYFTPVPGGWRLSADIVKRVTFRRINLVDPGEVAFAARAHVIFCRNVFIYFSSHAIRQILATIAPRMASGGYLFVGASESLLRRTTDFELREIGGALGYVRI